MKFAFRYGDKVKIKGIDMTYSHFHMIGTPVFMYLADGHWIYYCNHDLTDDEIERL